MSKAEKCIKKWEKKLAEIKRMSEKYGKFGYHSYPEQIKMAEEIIKDLSRLTNPLPIKGTKQ